MTTALEMMLGRPVTVRTKSEKELEGVLTESTPGGLVLQWNSSWKSGLIYVLWENVDWVECEMS